MKCLMKSSRKFSERMSTPRYTTHMQHYPPQIPYFRAFQDIKTIVQNKIQNLQTTLKALCFGGFLYVRIFENFIKKCGILNGSTHVAHKFV